MRGRIRIAAVSMVAAMAIGALSSSAGAASSGGSYSVSANGGFISLSALNLIGLTGAGSSASAGSSAPTDASGTGLCLTISVSSSTCPNTTDASSSDVINTTANASVTSAGGSSTPAAKCLVPPLSLVLITVQAACGTASASQDANGNPTAAGEGNLAKVVVGLGALPGMSTLFGTSGSLCGSSSSLNSSTGASAGLVGSLLGAVNSLLSVTGKTPLSNATNGPLDSVCSILSGLVGQLPVLGGLVNASASTNLLTVVVGDSTSTETTSTDPSSGDTLVTSKATTEGVEINLLNMLDVKLLPNVVSVTIDTTTGVVQQPTAVTGVLSIQAGSSAPSTIALPDLSSVLTNLLNSLGLSGLINPQLTTVAESSTTLAPDKSSGSAESADLKLDLLDGLVVLNLGDAKVAATAAEVAPAIITSPSVTPAAAPPAATLPPFTTVHTGEFWAGTLPIVLVAAMALAGLMLVARRRVASVARSLMPFARHSTFGSAGGPPPGPASGTSSVPPPVSGPARRQPQL